MRYHDVTMRKPSTKLLVGGVAALAVLGLAGGAALATANTAPINLHAADASQIVPGMSGGYQPGPGHRSPMTTVHLQAMPVGTVSLTTSGSTLQARVSAYGLTPGSTHLAEITSGSGQAPIVFSHFTANSTGQVDTTVSSVGSVSGMPDNGTFQIELSTSADSPIADAPVGGAPMNQPVHLQAVNPTGEGHLAGQARLDYDSRARTLTVTVDASGFEANSVHAAHIHSGSCAAQGAVLYMLQDLHADGQGQIHQTDVLRNITSFRMPSAGWYINIHRGDSNDILGPNGQPTANFRPLLCSDLPSIGSGSGGGWGSGGGSGSGGGTGSPGPGQPYTFRTLNNPADPTFNQLLGINDGGTVAGYFGSGQAGHPNKGYLLQVTSQPTFTNDNYPGSTQTQVTGLSNRGETVGFLADTNGDNVGFAEHNGVYRTYRDPATGAGTVNQLLGVNDAGWAVGFYTDSSGGNHAYEVNLRTRQYKGIQVPGGTDTVATGINAQGDITGFSTNADKVTFGWLLHQGQVSTFDFPGSSDTTPLGINARGEIVGAYVDSANHTHGFTLTEQAGHDTWATVNDPNGMSSTTVNGVNDAGQLVGFYTDAAGNTDGFLASR